MSLPIDASGRSLRAERFEEQGRNHERNLVDLSGRPCRRSRVVGTLKLALAMPELRQQMRGVDWLGDGALRGLGLLEVLGAVGLIGAAVSGVAPILVPLAASGLAIVALGATTVHLRIGERSKAALTLTLAALAVVVAWGRQTEPWGRNSSTPRRRSGTPTTSPSRTR